MIVDGQTLSTSDQGFLRDWQQWNPRVAEAIAEQSNIQLSEAHWEIIHFSRNYYAKYSHLPNNRVFVKAVARGLGADKGNNQYLHRLFPDGPLRSAFKIGGLPKPPTCF